MKVSIIIINYNYARFLPDSIESCINQTYRNLEIIVVDDGSTDESRDVIDHYNKSIKKIYQANKGMVEASNSGFAVSTGDIIIFLDADDYLYENAVEKIVEKWKPDISKLHYRLQKIDQEGNKIGLFPHPSYTLDEGEVWKKIIINGFYVSVPTSGNAFSRKILEQIFPIKDAKYSDNDAYLGVIPTDAYLKLRVPFLGNLVAIQEPLGVYRIHGKNNGAIKSPYFSQQKRQRVLNLAKLNSIFIMKQLQKKEINWNEDILFRKNKMMVIRILSYRFDGNNHLWNEDTIFRLMLKLIKIFFSSSNDKLIRKSYNLVINLLLLFLIKQWSEVLLRKIHPKITEIK